MINRFLYTQVQSALANFPAVAILGPRQVGKTTLSFELSKALKPGALYLDLEKPSDRIKLSDPELYLSRHADRLVILDEIQRMPDLFNILRGLIDERRRQNKPVGHFLLLGSASKDLLQQSSESLAGRIVYLELAGLNVLEVGQEKTDVLWLRGGFPDSFLAWNEDLSLAWRESFITTYLEREIPVLGSRIPAETMRRFWTMLAYNQGELLNSSRLATNLGLSSVTIGRYIDLLSDLFMIRTLRPWSSNVGKRLVKTPKVYIRDSGLMHALLGHKTLENVLSHPTVGMSWEGFVIDNIAAAIGKKANLFFYRTSGGAEMDLLIEYGPNEIIAVEIKKSLTPTLTKGFYESISDIKPVMTYVIYSGVEQFSFSNEVEFISLAGFLELLAKRS